MSKKADPKTGRALKKTQSKPMSGMDTDTRESLEKEAKELKKEVRKILKFMKA